MAAAIKAINARIRANPVTDYFCSTRKSLSSRHGYSRCIEYSSVVTDHIIDFWGPASNFGIPIAAVLDTQKDPEMFAFPSTNSVNLQSRTCEIESASPLR